MILLGVVLLIVCTWQLTFIVDHAMLKRLAAAWATKWDGRWQYEGRDGGLFHTNGGMALVFEVKPTRILAFAKGTFSQTRYQF